MKRYILVMSMLSVILFSKVIEFDLGMGKKANLEVADRDVFVNITTKIKLKDLPNFRELEPNKNIETFLIKDYNFDGYSDIAVLSSYGMANIIRDLYIYNSDTKEYKKVLKDTSNLQIDKDNRQLSTNNRVSASQYNKKYYKISEDFKIYKFWDEKRVVDKVNIDIYNKDGKIKKSFSKKNISQISSISEVKNQYSKTTNSLNTLSKSKHSLNELSLEGGEVEVYKNSDGEINFANLVLYGETYKVEYNFYFKNSVLFFVYEVSFAYNEPMYSEGFDIDKAIKKVNRFYFVNEELAKWLDENKNSISTDDNKFYLKEREILAMSREVLAF